MRGGRDYSLFIPMSGGRAFRLGLREANASNVKPSKRPSKDTIFFLPKTHTKKVDDGLLA